VKQERDGGWPEAYQLERQRPFDDAEYQRLYPWFFEEQDVCAGVRESRTRSGTLRTTQRITRTKKRIDDWPRLRGEIEQLRLADCKEETLKHLRCLRMYLMHSGQQTLPRILRPVETMSGFADGEHIDLTASSIGEAEDKCSAPEDIDLEEVADVKEELAGEPHQENSLPAIGDRVLVEFDDDENRDEYIGTVISRRDKGRSRPKPGQGATKKTKGGVTKEFEVIFDADQEKWWISLDGLWSRAVDTSGTSMQSALLEIKREVAATTASNVIGGTKRNLQELTTGAVPCGGAAAAAATTAAAAAVDGLRSRAVDTSGTSMQSALLEIKREVAATTASNVIGGTKRNLQELTTGAVPCGGAAAAAATTAAAAADMGTDSDVDSSDEDLLTHPFKSADELAAQALERKRALEAKRGAGGTRLASTATVSSSPSVWLERHRTGVNSGGASFEQQYKGYRLGMNKINAEAKPAEMSAEGLTSAAVAVRGAEDGCDSSDVVRWRKKRRVIVSSSSDDDDEEEEEEEEEDEEEEEEEAQRFCRVMSRKKRRVVVSSDEEQEEGMGSAPQLVNGQIITITGSKLHSNLNGLAGVVLNVRADGKVYVELDNGRKFVAPRQMLAAIEKIEQAQKIERRQRRKERRREIESWIVLPDELIWSDGRHSPQYQEELKEVIRMRLERSRFMIGYSLVTAWLGNQLSYQVSSPPAIDESLSWQEGDSPSSYKAILNQRTSVTTDDRVRQYKVRYREGGRDDGWVAEGHVSWDQVAKFQRAKLAQQQVDRSLQLAVLTPLAQLKQTICETLTAAVKRTVHDDCLMPDTIIEVPVDDALAEIALPLGKSAHRFDSAVELLHWLPGLPTTIHPGSC
jgi:hypothetical protein